MAAAGAPGEKPPHNAGSTGRNSSRIQLPLSPSLFRRYPRMHTSPHVVTRRYFLRAARITLALPRLESLSPRVLGAGLGVTSKPGAPVGATRPRRLAATPPAGCPFRDLVEQVVLSPAFRSK